jgi:hypothetical protein
MALAAWSTSIIMARWKWATAPATASIRSSWVSAPRFFGDVSELVEEGVVAVLGSHVIQQEALLLSM